MPYRIERPKKTRDGKSQRAKHYRMAYRLPGAGGWRYLSLETSDKQVAEKLAKERYRELERSATGLVPSPGAGGFWGGHIERHIGDFVADLSASGRDAMYVYTTEKLLGKLVEECGWRVLGDVSADSFQAWRAKQRKAAKTLNEYHNALSGFFKWLGRCGRWGANPVAMLAKVKTAGKEVRKRRALGVVELERLLAVSGARRIGYLIAALTGLRRSEIAQLQWGDVRIGEGRGVIRARASTTKNGREALIPIHPRLLAELESLRAGEREAGEPVLGPGQLAGMPAMKRDLEAAGIAFEDGQGRRADFHALRMTFNMLLAGSGADMQTRKAAMRHSDVKLTATVYFDESKLPVAAAVERIPLSLSAAGSVSVSALGSVGSDISGRGASPAGTGRIRDRELQTVDPEGDRRDLAASVAGWHEPGNGCLTRIRT